MIYRAEIKNIDLLLFWNWDCGMRGLSVDVFVKRLVGLGIQRGLNSILDVAAVHGKIRPKRFGIWNLSG